VELGGLEPPTSCLQRTPVASADVRSRPGSLRSEGFGGLWRALVFAGDRWRWLPNWLPVVDISREVIVMSGTNLGRLVVQTGVCVVYWSDADRRL